MILHMKISGIFYTLPLESMNVEWICKLTNSSKEDVQPVLDQLVKDKIIVGKRKYKLKKVPKHILNIPK